MFGSALTGG